MKALIKRSALLTLLVIIALAQTSIFDYALSESIFDLFYIYLTYYSYILIVIYMLYTSGIGRYFEIGIAAAQISLMPNTLLILYSMM